MTAVYRTISKIVLLVLFALIVWWLSISLDTDFKPTPRQITLVDSTSTVTRVIKSATPPLSDRAVESLIIQQGSYRCVQDQDKALPQNHSVIYLSDGKMRAEFHTTPGATAKASLFVYDGRFLYTWIDGAAVGKKSSITSLQQLPTQVPQDLTAGTINGNSYEIAGWSCRAWLTDNLMLAPPRDVKFIF